MYVCVDSVCWIKSKPKTDPHNAITLYSAYEIVEVNLEWCAITIAMCALLEAKLRKFKSEPNTKR